jgi:hypothetical protein
MAPEALKSTHGSMAASKTRSNHAVREKKRIERREVARWLDVSATAPKHPR